MALAAVAAGADGVMIDVHARPHDARCDGPQALLPDEAMQLGRRLHDLAQWRTEMLEGTPNAVALPA
jgi:3-deoxy-D-arabino-heptulosonate 7-phosphate (DAHP) synthase